MELTTAALVLLWAPLSFVAHTTMHEASHSLAASAYGIKTTEFHPFPSTRDGQFHFGYVKLERMPTSEAGRVVFFAPMLTELVYLSAVTSALVFLDLPPRLRTFLKLEALSSIVNMTWWWLGSWTRNRVSDSMRFSGNHDLRLTSVMFMVPVYTLGFRLVF